MPETVDNDSSRHKDSLLMDDKALAVFKQSENTLIWNILTFTTIMAIFVVKTSYGKIPILSLDHLTAHRQDRAYRGTV